MGSFLRSGSLEPPDSIVEHYTKVLLRELPPILASLDATEWRLVRVTGSSDIRSALFQDAPSPWYWHFEEIR